MVTYSFELKEFRRINYRVTLTYVLLLDFQLDHYHRQFCDRGCLSIKIGGLMSFISFFHFLVKLHNTNREL